MTLYSVVIIPGKLCYFVLGYHQYFPMTKAVLRRTGLFHSRVLAAALSVSACHIDFLRNRQHCVLLRKCYIRGAILPPIVVECSYAYIVIRIILHAVNICKAIT